MNFRLPQINDWGCVSKLLFCGWPPIEHLHYLSFVFHSGPLGFGRKNGFLFLYFLLCKAWLTSVIRAFILQVSLSKTSTLRLNYWIVSNFHVLFYWGLSQLSGDFNTEVYTKSNFYPWWNPNSSWTPRYQLLRTIFGLKQLIFVLSWYLLLKASRYWWFCLISWGISSTDENLVAQP